MSTFLFISGQEIFVIMIVVLLLFGADKVPEIARGIGKGMRDFRKATDEIRREIETSTRDIRNEMSDVQNTVQREVSDISGNIQNNIRDTTDSFKKDFQEATGDIQKNVNDINDAANSATGEYGYPPDDYANGYAEYRQASETPKTDNNNPHGNSIDDPASTENNAS